MRIPIPMTRPNLGEDVIEAVSKVIRSGWIMQGPEVEQLETEFAAAVSATNAVAVSSGTTALELALRCHGIGPGDDVVTVSHSFIATANAVVTVGAHPIFCDVTEVSFGMTASLAEGMLTPRTKAILCVHQLGFPCDLEGLVLLAKKRGLLLIEDAACALGSEIAMASAWERIGRPHGDVACFSFHPRKIITGGEGGMLTFRNDKQASRARSLRSHAMARNEAGPVVHQEPGYNLRMTDLQAAMIRVQLRQLDAIVAERRRLAQRYAAALAHHPDVRPPTESTGTRTNWQSYPLRMRPESDRPARSIMQSLLERGVSSRPGLTNAHLEPAYEDQKQATWSSLPVSEELQKSTILVPLFHGMTEEEQDAVIDALHPL